ncbi:hypothetical protein L3X38_007875 [Prunus dulcis]|uniref:Uncharacterized protein n=1 Tax=Prunus dulcis TaxID=3755 RepID=A0AAD5F6K8_PRUDU|nr:hypothetical protein L3X38_007875 [Prunus dulcis]
MGVQSDYASLENLKTTAQDSYPRYNTLFGTTFVLGPTPEVAGIEGRKPAKLPSFNRPSKRRNLPNLTQQAAITTLEVQNLYLDGRKWWLEVGERAAESLTRTGWFSLISGQHS